MSRGPDAATLLERSLVAQAESAGCAIAITRSDMVRWASATFVGARHILTLSARGSPLLDAWLAGLRDAEFSLRGYLVAELVVMGTIRDGGSVTATVEVLTVEDR
ncbi:hypothetical protein [Sphingomonas soli]|uniref:hypothetical protein n=1 Tax=Sphingomonas soli TaxID=266127 RepID=UPI000829B953|nr:hypothetical protein [Sphingomonas soli]